MENEERVIRVHTLDVKDPSGVRVRADSMRWTVIVDITDEFGEVKTFVVPRRPAVLAGLGNALAKTAQIVGRWSDNG